MSELEARTGLVWKYIRAIVRLHRLHLVTRQLVACLLWVHKRLDRGLVLGVGCARLPWEQKVQIAWLELKAVLTQRPCCQFVIWRVKSDVVLYVLVARRHWVVVDHATGKVWSCRAAFDITPCKISGRLADWMREIEQAELVGQDIATSSIVGLAWWSANYLLLLCLLLFQVV